MKLKLIKIPINHDDFDLDIERKVNITLKGYNIEKIISFNESDIMIKIWVSLK